MSTQRMLGQPLMSIGLERLPTARRSRRDHSARRASFDRPSAEFWDNPLTRVRSRHADASSSNVICLQFLQDILRWLSERARPAHRRWMRACCQFSNERQDMFLTTRLLQACHPTPFLLRWICSVLLLRYCVSVIGLRADSFEPLVPLHTLINAGIGLAVLKGTSSCDWYMSPMSTSDLTKAMAFCCLLRHIPFHQASIDEPSTSHLVLRHV